MTVLATTGDCLCNGPHVPPCIYAVDLPTNSNEEYPIDNAGGQYKLFPQYDSIIVDDQETKYKKLCESQERHIERLERKIESLEEELSIVRNSQPIHVPKAEDNPYLVNPTINPPQGIQLPSELRRTLEEKLRQKALIRTQIGEAVLEEK